MKKKYGIYYNEQFNVLMVALEHDLPVRTSEKINNLQVLTNAEKIVGINIFGVNLVNVKCGWNSENPQITSYVENALAPIIQLEQQAQFLIAKIVDCQPILNTHLSLCRVDICEAQLLPVVCGATNVKTGMYGVLAIEGAWMPNSQVISPKIIKGVKTCGMLCSVKELQLTDHNFNNDGIIELPPRYHKKLGQSFWKEFYAEQTA